MSSNFILYYPNSRKATYNFFTIMMHCYKDAFQIQHDLNGLADPEKVAITLFIGKLISIMNDSYKIVPNSEIKTP